MTSLGRASGWALVASLLLVPSACGSTAQPQAQTRSGLAPGDTLASTTDSSTSTDTGGASSPGEVDGAQPGGRGDVSGPVTSETGGSGPAGAGLVPAAGPGITDTEIFVGIPHGSDTGGVFAALGAADAAPTHTTEDITAAIVDYANRNGGFAGRRLVPLFYEYDATTDFSTQDQAACAHWTQDNRIFAVNLTYFAGTDILTACTERAQALAIGAGGATTPTFAKFPHLVEPSRFRLDRLAVATARGLHRAGYFSGKLGLVTWDEPNYHYTVDHGYRPTLDAVNVPIVDTAYIQSAQQLGDVGAMTAQISNAIVRFRSQGIDHVIVQDGPAGLTAGGLLTFEWTHQAKSQGFYPRYGLNVYNIPGWSVYPSDQMDHALAIDQSDYDPVFDEGWRTNQARERCYKLVADAGFPVQNTEDRKVTSHACDFVFFLQHVLNRMSVVSADEFIQETSRLGTSFASAYVYGTKFGPGQRDGGDLVRTAEFLASCNCLRYTGDPYSPDG